MHNLQIIFVFFISCWSAYREDDSNKEIKNKKAKKLRHANSEETTEDVVEDFKLVDFMS